MRRPALLAVLIASPLVLAAACLQNPGTPEPRNHERSRRSLREARARRRPAGRRVCGRVLRPGGVEGRGRQGRQASTRGAGCGGGCDCRRGARLPTCRRGPARRPTTAMARPAARIPPRPDDAVQARIRMLSGTKLTFDEESKALYDAVAPTYPASHFARRCKSSTRSCPGPARSPIASRRSGSDSSSRRDRSSPCSTRAIAECRARTLRAVQLPADEELHASSTSPTSRGAATTGIRATSTA